MDALLALDSPVDWQGDCLGQSEPFMDFWARNSESPKVRGRVHSGALYGLPHGQWLVRPHICHRAAPGGTKTSGARTLHQPRPLSNLTLGQRPGLS